MKLKHTKIQYMLIVFTFISCVQNKKEKKEIIVKVQDAVDVVIDSPKKVDDVRFDKIISEIKTKATPLIDSTNFDNFKEIDIYNKQEVEALKLEKLYPNFYKEGYNYKATASYKIEFSKDFHSIVLTILKGEHEMESVLINYDLNGNIIDSKVISYDEIAEGLFKIETKIEKNKITINYTEWTDEKHQLTDIYEVKANGELTFISEEERMINNVIKQLGLHKQKIKADLLTYVIFGDSKESIIVIPEIVDEGEHYFELNSHILIVDRTTGDIKHRYFESYKTNNWVSDALVLSKIKIDTAPYIVSENSRAFGVSVFFYGSSQANPYSNETISLFVRSGNSLKKVLHNYDVMNSRGEWDTACAGEFTDVNNTFIMSQEKTNGYFDILVKSKITESKAYIDENGDCDSKDKITAETTVLKFNGKTYKNNNDTFSAFEAYLNDPDPKGVNIRKEPNGKIILNLNKQDEYFILKISESKNGWFKVVHVRGAEIGLIKIPGEIGWINNSCILEAGTRRDITLIDKPQNGSIVGTIGIENQVTIKDKYSNWIKIEYKELTGWIESKWLCGNPFTTCP